MENLKKCYKFSIIFLFLLGIIGSANGQKNDIVVAVPLKTSLLFTPQNLVENLEVQEKKLSKILANKGFIIQKNDDNIQSKYKKTWVRSEKNDSLAYWFTINSDDPKLVQIEYGFKDFSEYQALLKILFSNPNIIKKDFIKTEKTFFNRYIDKDEKGYVYELITVKFPKITTPKYILKVYTMNTYKRSSN